MRRITLPLLTVIAAVACLSAQQTPSVAVAVKTCQVTLSAVQPSPGYAAQFQRVNTDGAIASVGTKDSAAPYTRTTTLVAGTYTFRAVWTKSGAPTLTSPAIASGCPEPAPSPVPTPTPTATPTPTPTVTPTPTPTVTPTPTPTPTPTVTPTPIPTPPAGVPSFAYLGSFYAPITNSPGISNALLAARTVNGQLRFFDQMGNCGALIEFTAPATLGTTRTSAPTATLVKNWGSITAGRTVNAQGQPLANLLCTQLGWDATANGLWWSYFNNYNVTGAMDPSLGFTALPDAAPAQSFGPWMFPGTAHTTNRWIGRHGSTFYVGSIGTESGNASSSWGPALSAITNNLDPRVTPIYSSGALPLTRLIHYPISAKAPRAPDWVTHGNPDTSGLDRWDQNSGYAGTGTIIDGWFAFLGPQSTGHVWYGDNNDLIHVGTTEIDPGNHTGQGPHTSSPQRLMLYLYQTPKQAWDAAVDLSAVGGLYNVYKTVNGSYYDAPTKRLYVAVKGMGGCCDYRPLYNVYQVK